MPRFDKSIEVAHFFYEFWGGGEILAVSGIAAASKCIIL